MNVAHTAQEARTRREKHMKPPFWFNNFNSDVESKGQHHSLDGFQVDALQQSSPQWEAAPCVLPPYCPAQVVCASTLLLLRLSNRLSRFKPCAA